ncbi:MAG: HEPN domain-containing protein [Candidatus Omnitrophica bacterium]|nr:HEPN domain-containing protein [Candidatus Omnitrophota bacterium]
MSAARPFKTRQVDNSDYLIYLKKAKEFYATMYQAEKAGNWNAVGLNGVHCVISLIDAILVKYSGLRSSGEDHSKVVDLLTSSVVDRIKDVSQKAQTAKRVIAKKNIVAYENRDFFKREALEMIKQVQRFYDWATGQF